MSEATKNSALAHAIAHHAGTINPAAVIQTATLFHNFLVGETAAQGVAALVSPQPGKATPAKADAAASKAKADAAAKAKADAAAAKAKAAQAEAEAEAETDEEVPENGPTKEEVGEAVEALLNANLRKQAVALFAKYKAKSLSGVAPSDYAAMLSDANDLLLSA